MTCRTGPENYKSLWWISTGHPRDVHRRDLRFSGPEVWLQVVAKHQKINPILFVKLNHWEIGSCKGLLIIRYRSPPLVSTLLAGSAPRPAAPGNLRTRSSRSEMISVLATNSWFCFGKSFNSLYMILNQVALWKPHSSLTFSLTSLWPFFSFGRLVERERDRGRIKMIKRTESRIFLYVYR